MYLKRLEIVGFKSFADKIRLEFLPGVTAVVGPNGSGKSNISDALRWVLGEQSIKNLRGARMDDVIFAGSEFRKALGLAEVTMVLDNSDRSVPLDYTEIAVTRRLFRSGVSEYLINKSQVRLRDIQELFFDTGLGKDAYSVIGQGKIDSVLSAKADERRSIFEEAAGIIKYKSRRQIAERKLEETDRSLVRIRDIINELANRMGPLEVQSALAVRFLEYQEALATLEINFCGRKIMDLHQSLTGMTKAREDLDEKFRDLEGQSAVLDSEIEERRLELMNRDERLNSLHEDYYRIQNAIDKYSEQENFLASRVRDLDGQERDLEQALSDNDGRKQSMVREQTKIDQEIELVKERLRQDQLSLVAAEEGLISHTSELQHLEEEEQNLKDALIGELNGIAALKNQANSAALQQDFIQKQVADCLRKLETLKSGRTEAEEKRREQETALQTVNAGISENRKSQTELGQRIVGLEESISHIELKNQEWRQKIRGLEGKISVLAEMEKSHQGYFQGVKALMDEAAGQSFHASISGIVADLIKVKPGMELALETALGSALQYIVIENDRAAQEAIDYLKRNGKGRATFLPLNQVRASEPRISQYRMILNQYGAHPAMMLLEFDPRFQQVFNYLLNQVIVAPDLKTAVQLGSKMDRSFRIVTPEGDLVNPGGSITGGSMDRRRLGLLSRRREIEDLKNERKDSEAFLEKGLQGLEAERDELKKCRQKIENYQKLDHESNLQRVALEREAQATEQVLTRILDEMKLLQSQREDLGQETAKFDTGKAELSQAIAAKEADLQATEQRLANLAGRLTAAKEAKERISFQISEIKSGLSAGNQELNGKILLKENFLKQAAEVNAYCGQFRQKIEQVRLERVKISETMVAAERQIAAEKERLSGHQKMIDAAKAEREQLMERIKEFETKQRGFRRKNSDFQNQIHRLELSINDRNNEIQHLTGNLTESYGEEWRQKIDDLWEEPQDTLERINRLKSDLKALGPVNIAAIEEYQQVKERYAFLTAQSEDLIKARESLKKVIAEIECTIVKRFNDTFQAVRSEFQKLFSDLFQGGHADLFLVDPEDVLNSGIEIVAQPPGKKLQTLSLLSGGERAMTAIALLFSILSIKPAPFCILDEIDAALDDANVQRFSRLLELFSERSQFVVVTHRRGTMEVANALYGVTMEEMGISKLISLDLNREKAG
jgi:chromosome segregation protein